MPETPDTRPALLDFDDRALPTRRRLYAAFVGVVGLGMAAVHVVHMFADWRAGEHFAALLTGAGVPLVLAMGIVFGGVALWRSDLDTTQLGRVDGWFLLGIVGLLTVSGAIVVYEILEGAQLTHVPYILLNFATAGGLAGLVVGWYDAHMQRQNEELRIFQQVVEHSGHSIYLTDPDGTIEYVNPAFEAQTGYEREDAVGATPRILKSGEHGEAFYAEMWETILSGEIWQAELVNARSDGSTYHVDQTIAPVMDGSGDVEHFVAINRDVTDRKTYEAELERQNDRLEEFASVVSHDLRNPLNVATGRLDLAMDECDSPNLPPVRRALDRMAALIEDVLTLAREGSTISDTEPVSLPSVCADAWEQVEAPEATVSVDTDLTVLADRSRLQQLFENLFRNAVDHGPADVRATVGEDDGAFYVEDDGPGIPEDGREQLFESGYTTSEEGTGLGLSIVSQIAEAHGWSVTATDGRDGGARFEISDVAPVETVEESAVSVGESIE